MGAIFAATDSVATLQVLDRNTMPGLFSLVFGEGVVNDAGERGVGWGGVGGGGSLTTAPEAKAAGRSQPGVWEGRGQRRRCGRGGRV